MTLKTDAKKGSNPNTFTFHLGPKVFMQCLKGMSRPKSKLKPFTAMIS